MATQGPGDGWRVAASKAVMRSGRHFVQFFAVVEHNDLTGMLFGVIRPGWDVEGGEFGAGVDGHCFYAAGSGRRYPGHRDWKGMENSPLGDRIGLLLDLDQAACQSGRMMKSWV